MKTIVFNILFFSIVSLSKCQDSLSYTPYTEHQYEIHLTNATQVYEQLGDYIDSCESNQCQNGILTILYIIDNKGEILSTCISKKIKFNISDEIGLLNYIKSSSLIELSDDAKKYYQVSKKDTISFYYNYSGKNIIWKIEK